VVRKGKELGCSDERWETWLEICFSLESVVVASACVVVAAESPRRKSLQVMGKVPNPFSVMD